MAEIKLGIRFYWDEQPGDCTRCHVCKEPIYLKKFVPVIEAGATITEFEYSLCETCFTEMTNGE